MPRGRKLLLTIIGSVVTAAALVTALIQVNRSTPPKAASSPTPQISASANSQAGKSAPVVIPRASSTYSFSYISEMTPSSNLGELIYPGRGHNSRVNLSQEHLVLLRQW
jgi:hypothetical protein